MRLRVLAVCGATVLAAAFVVSAPAPPAQADANALASCLSVTSSGLGLGLLGSSSYEMRVANRCSGIPVTQTFSWYFDKGDGKGFPLNANGLFEHFPLVGGSVLKASVAGLPAGTYRPRLRIKVFDSSNFSNAQRDFSLTPYTVKGDATPAPVPAAPAATPTAVAPAAPTPVESPTVAETPTDPGTGRRVIEYTDGRPADTCIDNPGATGGWAMPDLPRKTITARRGTLLTWADLSIRSGVDYCSDMNFGNFLASGGGRVKGKPVCKDVGEFPDYRDYDSRAGEAITKPGGVKLLRKGTCYVAFRAQRGGLSITTGQLVVKVR